MNFMIISDQFGIWSSYHQAIAASIKTELETGHMATRLSPRASPRTAAKGHSTIFCPAQQEQLRPVVAALPQLRDLCTSLLHSGIRRRMVHRNPSGARSYIGLLAHSRGGTWRINRLPSAK